MSWQIKPLPSTSGLGKKSKKGKHFNSLIESIRNIPRRRSSSATYRKSSSIDQDAYMSSSPVSSQLSTPVADKPSPLDVGYAQPLFVRVQLQFHDPEIDSEFHRRYEATVFPQPRFYYDFLRRLSYDTREFITRKDAAALNPCSGQVATPKPFPRSPSIAKLLAPETPSSERFPANNYSNSNINNNNPVQGCEKPCRFSITYAIDRHDVPDWAKATFVSYQRTPMTMDHSQEVIRSVDQIISYFLCMRANTFTWTEGAFRDPLTLVKQQTASPRAGPQSLQCIPRSRHLVLPPYRADEATLKSFNIGNAAPRFDDDTLPGYQMKLTVALLDTNSDTDSVRTEEAMVVHHTYSERSRQNSPLTLAFGEKQLESTMSSIHVVLEELQQKNPSHGPLPNNLSLLIRLAFRNNLGPLYEEPFTRQFSTHDAPFSAMEDRHYQLMIKQFQQLIQQTREAIDERIHSTTNDIEIQVKEIEGPEWQWNKALIFAMGPRYTYSRRTVEALLDRVQSGIAEILRSRDISLTLIVYKRGHLILEKMLTSRDTDTGLSNRKTRDTTHSVVSTSRSSTSSRYRSHSHSNSVSTNNSNDHRSGSFQEPATQGPPHQRQQMRHGTTSHIRESLLQSQNQNHEFFHSADQERDVLVSRIAHQIRDELVAVCRDTCFFTDLSQLLSAMKLPDGLASYSDKAYTVQYDAKLFGEDPFLVELAKNQKLPSSTWTISGKEETPAVDSEPRRPATASSRILSMGSRRVSQFLERPKTALQSSRPYSSSSASLLSPSSLLSAPGRMTVPSTSAHGEDTTIHRGHSVVGISLSAAEPTASATEDLDSNPHLPSSTSSTTTSPSYPSYHPTSIMRKEIPPPLPRRAISVNVPYFTAAPLSPAASTATSSILGSPRTPHPPPIMTSGPLGTTPNGASNPFPPTPSSLRTPALSQRHTIAPPSTRSRSSSVYEHHDDYVGPVEVYSSPEDIDASRHHENRRVETERKSIVEEASPLSRLSSQRSIPLVNPKSRNTESTRSVSISVSPSLVPTDKPDAQSIGHSEHSAKDDQAQEKNATETNVTAGDFGTNEPRDDAATNVTKDDGHDNIVPDTSSHVEKSAIVDESSRLVEPVEKTHTLGNREQQAKYDVDASSSVYSESLGGPSTTDKISNADKSSTSDVASTSERDVTSALEKSLKDMTSTLDKSTTKDENIQESTPVDQEMDEVNYNVSEDVNESTPALDKASVLSLAPSTLAYHESAVPSKIALSIHSELPATKEVEVETLGETVNTRSEKDGTSERPWEVESMEKDQVNELPTEVDGGVELPSSNENITLHASGVKELDNEDLMEVTGFEAGQSTNGDELFEGWLEYACEPIEEQGEDSAFGESNRPKDTKSSSEHTLANVTDPQKAESIPPMVSVPAVVELPASPPKATNDFSPTIADTLSTTPVENDALVGLDRRESIPHPASFPPESLKDELADRDSDIGSNAIRTVPAGRSVVVTGLQTTTLNTGSAQIRETGDDSHHDMADTVDETSKDVGSPQVPPVAVNTTRNLSLDMPAEKTYSPVEEAGRILSGFYDSSREQKTEPSERVQAEVEETSQTEPTDRQPGNSSDNANLDSQFGSNPLGSNPFGSNPFGSNPFGTNPHGTNPLGTNPHGTNPLGTNPLGTNPLGMNITEIETNGVESQDTNSAEVESKGMTPVTSPLKIGFFPEDDTMFVSTIQPLEASRSETPATVKEVTGTTESTAEHETGKLQLDAESDRPDADSTQSLSDERGNDEELVGLASFEDFSKYFQGVEDVIPHGLTTIHEEEEGSTLTPRVISPTGDIPSDSDWVLVSRPTTPGAGHHENQPVSGQKEEKRGRSRWPFSLSIPFLGSAAVVDAASTVTVPTTAVPVVAPASVEPVVKDSSSTSLPPSTAVEVEGAECMVPPPAEPPLDVSTEPLNSTLKDTVSVEPLYHSDDIAEPSSNRSTKKSGDDETLDKNRNSGKAPLGEVTNNQDDTDARDGEPSSIRPPLTPLGNTSVALRARSTSKASSTVSTSAITVSSRSSKSRKRSSRLRPLSTLFPEEENKNLFQNTAPALGAYRYSSPLLPTACYADMPEYNHNEFKPSALSHLHYLVPRLASSRGTLGGALAARDAGAITHDSVEVKHENTNSRNEDRRLNRNVDRSVAETLNKNDDTTLAKANTGVEHSSSVSDNGPQVVFRGDRRPLLLVSVDDASVSRSLSFSGCLEDAGDADDLEDLGDTGDDEMASVTRTSPVTTSSLRQLLY